MLRLVLWAILLVLGEGPALDSKMVSSARLQTVRTVGPCILDSPLAPAVLCSSVEEGSPCRQITGSMPVTAVAE